MTQTKYVIAIDGVSYAGKSSVARELAILTKCAYINTGHMYRAVAKLALEQGLDLTNGVLMGKLAQQTAFEFKARDGDAVTLVNGQDWSTLLDGYEIVRSASKVACLSSVREALIEKQRGLAKGQTVILEGRDIGTNVFPDAEYKFFIDASVEIRAKRMLKMMNNEAHTETLSSEELERRIRELDDRDKNREVSPLKIAEDAIIYNNTNSPTAKQDASVLHDYMKHRDEIIKNANKLKEMHLEVPSGNDRGA